MYSSPLSIHTPIMDQIFNHLQTSNKVESILNILRQNLSLENKDSTVETGVNIVHNKGGNSNTQGGSNEDIHV